MARMLFKVSCGIVAAAAVVLFGKLALQDQTATASVVATLCLAFTLLAGLDLQLIKGFGLEAQIRNIDAAADRLKQIDAITRSFARTSFLQIARAQASWDEKRSMVADLTASLLAFGISAEDINQLKAPFYLQIAETFFWALGGVRAQYLSTQTNAVQSRMQAIAAPQDEHRQRDQARLGELTASTIGERPSAANVSRLRTVMIGAAALIPFETEGDRRNFEGIVDESAQQFDDCLREGNVTEAAIAAFAAHQSYVSPVMSRYLGMIRAPFSR